MPINHALAVIRVTFYRWAHGEHKKIIHVLHVLRG